MRKATHKANPVSLGRKRGCPRCGTKFYDFNKEEPTCPKCEVKVSGHNPENGRAAREPVKKVAKPVDKELGAAESLLETDELTVTDESTPFESMDELDSNDDDVVEEIEVTDDEKEDY
ncbi:MAG: FYDLN acid domain-containing protein [Deltaproteobacteria bacterium]|nr:FYDLN acid domain-containing protein [Deltaproteobacteria bacterium]